MIVIINKGKVEVRKENGSLANFISCSSGDVVSANINNDNSLVVITTSKGKVELRKVTGQFAGGIMCNGDALDAKFSGDDIVIRTSKGKTEIRGKNGNLKRII